MYNFEKQIEKFESLKNDIDSIENEIKLLEENFTSDFFPKHIVYCYYIYRKWARVLRL